MTFRSVCCIACLALLTISPLAGGQAAPGAPQNLIFGCDSDGACTITFDEQGHILADFSGNLWNFLGPVTFDVHEIAPTVNPAWVDGTGAALQVTSYLVTANSFFASLQFFPGAIGLCEFGVAAGCDNSDVVIFTPLGGADNRIDFLSDNEAFFPFATDFNVLEAGAEDIFNGASYLGVCQDAGTCNVEQIRFNIVSDGSIPEPSTLVLLSVPLYALARKLRKRAEMQT